MKRSEKNPHQRQKEIPTDTALNPGAMFINEEYHPESSNQGETEERPNDHEDQNAEEDSGHPIILHKTGTQKNTTLSGF